MTLVLGVNFHTEVCCAAGCGIPFAMSVEFRAALEHFGEFATLNFPRLRRKHMHHVHPEFKKPEK